MQLEGWVGLAAFARERGVHTRTMRRWAIALDHQMGGGILRSMHRQGKPRKYWVHPEALKAALARDPEAREADRELLEVRLERVEKKVEALKKAYKGMKEQLNLPFSAAPSP